ncbi:activating signal cointegrator 1 complex subunit 2 homolog [Hibiscus syriacus]|uniref:activating signal cointegrator 1 complex subunit 2 homolog n=1 Tax=Hibiscus syriacus TaxID=106335 RepID=UPI001921FD38|nr:activating signal cointegrator 1 complex subunit 2 homolog [Hibiscus syriacus]
MSQSSQGSPFMDANQRNQVDDYSDGRLGSDNTGKSRQQHHQESCQSSDHLQQKLRPKESNQSSEHLQQKHCPKESYQSSDHLLQQRWAPRESYQGSDDLQQQQQPRKSYQSSDHLQQQPQAPRGNYQSSYHLQQQHQPPKSSLSSDHLQQQHTPRETYQSSFHLQQQHQPPKSYQSFNHLKQKQPTVTDTPSEAYAVNDDSSLINKVASDHSASVTGHSRDAQPSGYQSSHSQTPRVEAHLTHEQNPNNYNHRRLLLYHEERDNSTEAWGENVPVRKASNKPKSSCCQ